MTNVDAATSGQARPKTEGPIPPDGIAILIDETGRPYCDPYYAHAHRGDTVRWHFQGRWVVIFQKRTPLESGQLFVQGSGNQPPVRIAEDAQHRHHYPYSLIAVRDEDGAERSPIYFDLACPEIIIE